MSNIFIQAEKVWKNLSVKIRYWRSKRLAIQVQSLLRSYLTIKRNERVDLAAVRLRGLLALMSNAHLTLGLKRRAVVKIQSIFRMYQTRKVYKHLRLAKTSSNAATLIQANFRGLYIRQRTGPELEKNKMLKSIRIMQASIRRLFCTKIMYLSAVRRLRDTSAQTIQSFFRALWFKRKREQLQGLRFLAVRAKFIAFILAHAQIKIARYVRGYLVRKHHLFHVARICVVRKHGRDLRKKYLAATKIRNYWKMWIIRKQYLYIRRLTLALQMQLRTSLAVREYVGPRLPLTIIR
jgi:hypothetical protein